jgi:autotransporter-associated beta strand protein
MSRQLLVRVLRVAALAAMLAAAWPAAHAQNVTWTGTSSTLWTENLNWLNWSAGAFTSGTANLFFTGSSGTSNNNIGSGTYRSLNFLSPLSAPLTLTGSSLTLAPAASVSGSASRSGNTVTVTRTGHGLVTGQFASFVGGNSTLNTTAQITVINDDTFTYSTSGSGSVASGGINYTVATLTNLNTTAGSTVTIQNNLILSNTQTLAGSNAVTIISGNVSGTGAPAFTSANGGTFVLAGSNSWTGAPTQLIFSNNTLNTGSGGLLVTNGYVRFQGDASLPTGAPLSGTSYIAALGWNNGGNISGIRLTGSASEAVYDLPSNYRFVLALNNNDVNTASFGADGGKARIQGSGMLLNANTGNGSYALEVRTGAELTLGATGSALNLIPTMGINTTTSSTPTTFTNATTARSRTLNKTGPGTLVLDNLNYTTLDLSGTTDSVFQWGINDGAVRGRAMNADGATSSNSLQGFFINMAGGVYEIDASGSTATLSIQLGSAAVSGSTRINMSNTGGAGFSAFNGDAFVNLNSGSSITWSGFFVKGGEPLIFGSETATGVITFTNALNLNNATREIRVLNNTASTNDYAVMSGVLSNGSLSKTGPGRLVLSASNTYSGTTTISAGVLEVGSAGRINSSGRVTINGGELRYNANAGLSAPITFTQGTISGTGAIGSAITVGTGQFISPGNSPGIQPYTNGLTFAPGGTYQWEINALSGTVGTNWDAVNVTGVTGPLNLSGLTPSNKFNLDLITLTGSNTRGPLASPYDGGSYVFPIALYSSPSSLTVPVEFSNAAGSDLTSLFNIMLTNWLDPKPNPADISVKVNDTGTGLNLIVVPEPATIALAGIAAACAGVMAWRRRRPTT